MSEVRIEEALSPLGALREAVLRGAAALAAAGAAGGGTEAKPAGASRLGGTDAITLERPPRADFGDYSTNAALVLAPVLGGRPREVAEALGAQLAGALGESLRRFEVAGPGFLNLFLADGWHLGALAGMLRSGAELGARGGVERSERVLIEFVSANPTGPMHVGHARNAAYGDALARVLELYGHEVEREFYVNDAGSQIVKLGESIRALARGEEVGEDGYRGEYVKELAAGLPGAAEMDAAK
ncbi:MAG TPA: arginine--tRNA ligase, partial [Solirubrobacteraceae bacterium]|nr:arginine--tRNA ligase [Solirubrobacteraceae bacterium]